MSIASPTYHPLRDYSGFYSPKKEIRSEEIMLEKIQELVRRYYYNDKDFEFFSIKNGVEQGKARDLTLSAAVLRFLALNNTKTKVRALNFRGVETSKQLGELTQRAFAYIEYGLKKAGKALSIKTLLVKAKAFLKKNFSLAFLIHKQNGNQNAAKAWQKNAQDVLLGLYANPGSDIKLLESEVYERYNAIAKGEREFVNEITGELIDSEAQKLPVIRSKSTIWNFFQNEWVQRITAKLRHGSKYYNDHYRPYVKGVKPNYSLSFASSDGQVIPFRLRVNGVDTWKRAVCYFIFDVKTGAVIGYSIAPRETKQLMSEAFADMLITTKGVKPCEIQLDNFGKSYLKELEQIFPEVSFCKPLNPQSKYAEGFIKHFEQKFCRNEEGWTGANITARNKHNAHRRNPDYDQRTYSITEIKAMYARLISAYNNEILKGTTQTRFEALENTINPSCEKIEETTLVSLFGKSTLSSVDQGYVRIWVNQQEHTFRVLDPNAVGAKQVNGQRVRVKYLPYMLDTKVWLYNFDKYDRKNTSLDTYLVDAFSLTDAQRAKAEQKLKDVKALGKLSKWAEKTENADDETAGSILQLREVENDPEAVLSAGYTDKDIMQGAEEQVGKEQGKAVRSSQLKKKKSKKLKVLRFTPGNE